MISKIDESVGDIVEALENKKMLKDTIIVFMSDNGAPSVRAGTPVTREFPNWGSNFPFRGVSRTIILQVQICLLGEDISFPSGYFIYSLLTACSNIFLYDFVED